MVSFSPLKPSDLDGTSNSIEIYTNKNKRLVFSGLSTRSFCSWLAYYGFLCKENKKQFGWG